MLEINRLGINEHENVYHGWNPVTKFDAIIAVHNTNLGPALGGCRAIGYDNFDAHLKDAMDLSRGMTYKNSLAGLDYGGGKTAINTYGGKLTEDMLKELGEMLEFVNKDGWKYTTAGDVGTSNAHLETLSKYTKYVAGFKGSDSGESTAYGVYQAMLGALDYRGEKIEDQTVSIQGFGKVGRRLGKFVAADGGWVIASDVHDIFPDGFPKNHGKGSSDTAYRDGTIFAPCALGGAVGQRQAEHMPKGNIICGGANNQIAEPYINAILADKGIHYVPDYLANAGGVIVISKRMEDDAEYEYDHPVIKEKLEKIRTISRQIFEFAEESGLSTSKVANAIAEERFKKDNMPRFTIG